MGRKLFSFIDLVIDVATMPIAIVADIATLGGTLNDRNEPYTSSSLSNINNDVEKIIKNN